MKTKKVKNILFRTDSSSTIGTGHIMRDLVLAQREFKNDRVIFATQNLEGNINHKIKEAGFAIETLRSNDIEELDTVIQHHPIDMIVIDHYGIDESYEKRLSALNPELSIMVIDDTYERHWCHTLINPNPYAKKVRYQNRVPKHCHIRCGQKEMLIRQEFYEAKKRCTHKKEKFMRIFLGLGGSDPKGLNFPVLQALGSYDSVVVDIITTHANPHLSKLQDFAQRHDTWTTLHIDTNEVAKWLCKADLAIVSPSVTLNEVLFMQKPFIAIQTAENQKEMVHWLKARNEPVLTHFDAKDFQKEIEKWKRNSKPHLPKP